MQAWGYPISMVHYEPPRHSAQEPYLSMLFRAVLLSEMWRIAERT
jgi:hypothetical protein